MKLDCRNDFSEDRESKERDLSQLQGRDSIGQKLVEVTSQQKFADEQKVARRR